MQYAVWETQKVINLKQELMQLCLSMGEIHWIGRSLETETALTQIQQGK